MNKEEIKEILDKLDYITERTESDILVNDYAVELKNNIIKLQKENEMLKSRNEKAIEFLKEYHNYENRFKWCEQDYIETINQVEKILQGDDKE